MAYNAEAQKKYREKTINFLVKYYPTDIEYGQKLKELIKADLDSKGI